MHSFHPCRLQPVPVEDHTLPSGDKIQSVALGESVYSPVQFIVPTNPCSTCLVADSGEVGRVVDIMMLGLTARVPRHFHRGFAERNGCQPNEQESGARSGKAVFLGRTSSPRQRHVTLQSLISSTINLVLSIVELIPRSGL